MLYPFKTICTSTKREKATTHIAARMTRKIGENNKNKIGFGTQIPRPTCLFICLQNSKFANNTLEFTAMHPSSQTNQLAKRS